MNFATFSTVNAGGTHFVTAGGQIQKMQQNVAQNGGSMQQVVGMVGGVSEGVQYVRAIDNGALQTPQLISVPIALPGSKPGDPQPTVQIQVLNPNVMQQQQHPKYQMQIPIQGFQQGAVLTLAYSPDDAGGIQLIGNSVPEGLQVLMGQDVQMMQQTVQQDTKDQSMHQVFITPNQQIVINNPQENKALNNNTTNNNNNTGLPDVVIKEECDVEDVDESSQGTELSEDTSWQTNTSGHADLLKYLNTLQPQQTQALPVSLQQFLRMNPNSKKMVEPDVAIEVKPMPSIEVKPLPMEDSQDTNPETAGDDDPESLLFKLKKKKKYKKRPTKPARPKPGQVVIAQASDGTPIFCCPECQMAYPEKEQLEMHLSVHKIERRFICGICGAGLKRKEHLERHKLGHNPERPYVCGVCHKGFKRREHLNLHTVIHSGVKTEMCGECGKGFYRKDHLRKHTRSHESRRAREEAPAAVESESKPTNLIPEITIHVPTSANMQVPVQIHIPQHVMNSLQQQQASASQATLDAILAQRS